MLDLETLIIILFVLIVLIIGDGVRRVLRDRGSRLRVRIDPRLRDLAEEQEYEERNPELPSGSARVIRRDEGAGPRMGNVSDLDGEESGAPPVMMEPEHEQRPPVPSASQPDLFADQAAADAAAGRAAAASSRNQPEPEAELAPAPEMAQQEPEPAPAAAPVQDILEVMVVHLVSPADQPFQGRALLQQLLEQGMRYGEMSIFHCHGRTSEGPELLFSMANAMEPGTFDIDAMEKETFRGVTFFLKLPGPSQPQEALDRMVSVTRRLAQSLGGELRDDQRSVLTPQTVEHMRQRIQEFERRQRVMRGG